MTAASSPEDSGTAAPTWHSWPDAPVPGIFTLRCTCPVFVHVGDYESMRRASRMHDDSPWTNHIVTIADYQETP